jgi:hypothetical protein
VLFSGVSFGQISKELRVATVAMKVAQQGTVTLVSVGAWKDRWGEHRNGVVQGPPLVRHERGMEVWM